MERFRCDGRAGIRAAASMLVVIGALWGGASPAFGASPSRLTLRAPARVRAGSLISVTGQVKPAASGMVKIQQRAGGRWIAVASGRANRGGRFVLTWPAPTHVGVLVVRAAEGARSVVTSSARTLRVLALAKGKRPVVASGNTEVLSPAVVSSAPAPGTAGLLAYSGGNEAHVGQIIAIGAGAATPDGFLGRVTGIRQEGSRTVLSTVPATLLEAVPNGSLNLTAASTSASVATAPRARPRATVTCQGSASASLTHSVSFNVGITLKGSWSLLHGLTSASLTADASANASVQAVLKAAGSCSLDSTPILSFPGPSVDTFIGPVPVVMTSKVTVYLDASASASASVTDSASAGFSASAGIGWTKSGGFYPIQRMGAHFGFAPPTVSADASVDASLTPTVDVLLYGVVGPEIALKAGLDFSADVHQNPWWTLDAPLDVTASVTIPPLKLKSPTLDVYRHTFHVADAGGPFGPSSGGNAGGGTGGGSGSGGSGGGGTGSGSGGESGHVTPLGPTSGPSGFGLTIAIPSCSYAVEVSFDGQPTYAVEGGFDGQDTLSAVPQIFLSPGSHQVSFACLGPGGAVTWTDPGFTVQVTAPAIPMSLESTTVAPGGDLTFLSGASAGPSPCPALPGYPAPTGLAFWLDGATGPISGQGDVPMPDGVSSESLAVPATLAGGSYTAEEECVYGTQPSAFFWFAPQTVTVT